MTEDSRSKIRAALEARPGGVTPTEAAEMTGLTYANAGGILRAMAESGDVVRERAGRGYKYWARQSTPGQVSWETTGHRDAASTGARVVAEVPAEAGPVPVRVDPAPADTVDVSWTPPGWMVDAPPTKADILQRLDPAKSSVGPGGDRGVTLVPEDARSRPDGPLSPLSTSADLPAESVVDDSRWAEQFPSPDMRTRYYCPTCAETMEGNPCPACGRYADGTYYSDHTP